jgi:hypothetical protein
MVHTSDWEGFCGSPSSPWKEHDKRKIVKYDDEACSEFVIKPPERVRDILQCQECSLRMTGVVDCTSPYPSLGEICTRKEENETGKTDMGRLSASETVAKSGDGIIEDAVPVDGTNAGEVLSGSNL